MDSLRDWATSNSDLLWYLGAIVLGIIAVVRLRDRALLAGSEPEQPFAKALWRLTHATRFDVGPSILRRTVTFGLAMALVWGIFSVPTLIEVAIRGRYYECGRTSKDICDWLRSALIGPVAAGLMGVILGIGWPYARRLRLAIPIGIVAIAPFIAQFVAPNAGPLSAWDKTDTVLLVVISVPAGSFLGYLLWKRAGRATTGNASVEGSTTQ